MLSLFKKYSISLYALLLSSGMLHAQEPATPEIDELVVYVARSIVTMETSMPTAEAVAVANGRIVSVGTLESLKSWTDNYKTTVDESFKDKVLMPGFIDPHLHPSLPAVLTLLPFIAPEEWRLPTGDFPAVTNGEDYIAALKEQVAKYPQSPFYSENIPFITWGFHQLWHGDVYRARLDALYPETPVILWHRSFHELVANTAAIKMLEISEEESKKYPIDIDWDRGLFTEYGAKAVFVPKLMARILTAERYQQGMRYFVEMLHRGGITSAMDMGIGIFGDPEGEIALINASMTNAPARIVLTPIVTDFIGRKKTPEQALKQVREWEALSNDKVILDGHFKLMMDGAAFSGLGQMGFPGYIDGHSGIWMSPLETTYEYAEVFWNAGYQLHAHTNGDLSAAALVEFVDRLQEQKPRKDHRTSLEHFMYAKEDQLLNMAELGMAISANPYYQVILADIYAENWLGEDRARNMVPLGGAARAGLRIGLHSDAPMAPLSPLTLVTSAVERQTINGNKNNQAETLTVEQALRAITIDAAWLMRMEDQIGSIRAGKKADFVVLEKSPLKVRPAKIKDIGIWGTVYAGEKHPLN